MPRIFARGSVVSLKRFHKLLCVFLPTIDTGAQSICVRLRETGRESEISLSERTISCICWALEPVRGTPTGATETVAPHFQLFRSNST
jgi:hypothetical protein